MIRSAEKADFSEENPVFPGLRASCDNRYFIERAAEVISAISNIFGEPRRPTITGCAYSLVTKRPEDLEEAQRVPHFDGTDRRIFALLHYLGAPEQGGTSFFRHRQTGFETITSDRAATYAAAVSEERETDGPPPADYVRDSTSRYERITSVGARFNRALLYRGCTLHSGTIPQDFGFEQAPRQGRLTINSFIQCT